MRNPPSVRRAAVFAAAAATIAAVAGTAATPAAAATVSASAVNWAYVPSLCGHPAGHLRNGVLPGVPAMQGGVAVSGSVASHTLAIGRLRSGTGNFLAARVSCNAGGVPWPDHVILWGPRMRYVADFDVSRWLQGEHPWVRRVSIANQVLTVQVDGGGYDDDAGCCGQLAAKLTVGWSSTKKRFVLRHRTLYTERAAVRGLLAAVRSNDRTAAARWAGPSAVNTAMLWHGAQMSLTKCVGTNSGEWPSNVAWDSADRVCFVYVYAPGSYEGETYALSMVKPAWNRWRVAATTVYGG